jgi:serine protease Do
MSKFHVSNSYPFRKRLLASAAVFALIASGATGTAQAAAVDTSGLKSVSAPSFSEMIGRVKPAVVSIKVTMNSAEGPSGAQAIPDDVSPEMRRFFNRFGQEGGMPQHRAQPAVGEGSGFFVSADGYIVTNNHVVDGAKTVSVTTNDGKSLRAHVVGVDPRSDLAVLKADEKGDYPFVSFAKEAPRIGDWVVAIGNPYGLGGSATAGIVSAQGRSIATNPYDEFLQIDAPINKGNSGGPTFNARGEVVGVNTAIFSPSGGSVGIGFAIPADTVEKVVDALERDGRVARGFLGVKIKGVTPEMADALGLKQTAGAVVEQTEPGTPADSAGLKPGDVITGVNGRHVERPLDLTRSIGSLKPGEKAELSYLRDGAEKKATVTLVAQQGPKLAKASPAAGHGTELLGMELAPAGEVAGAGDRGVAIVDIDPEGAAAAKGLKEGDVILKVSGKPVSKPEEVKRDIIAAQQEGKKAVLLEVKTASGEHVVAFAVPEA